MIKEKLGLCPYKVICDEQGFILMPQIQEDIEKLKIENEEPKEIKNSEKSEKIKKFEESTEKAMEIKSPKEDENTTDWFDKNKLDKILAIINSNKFNHKNKIGKFKYNDIKNVVDNINKNTISETLARENLNALNELKNAEIKKKRLISNQKELLNLFYDLLKTISNYNNNNNNNNNNDNNESESESKSESENESENESESDCKIRQINNCFKTIDESKSFEEQIKLLKKQPI